MRRDKTWGARTEHGPVGKGVDRIVLLDEELSILNRHFSGDYTPFWVLFV